jgi:REP element-mobilizing transposase RayT
LPHKFHAEKDFQSSRGKKGERGIWQRRLWEHIIQDERDYERPGDYIYDNPVKHGHTKLPSTGIFFVAAGFSLRS